MSNLIHLAPCKHCPSAHFPPDPEAEDWKERPKAYRLSDGLFVCAWRPSKVCKGLCDFLEISEADVVKQVEEHPDSSTGKMVARMEREQLQPASFNNITFPVGRTVDKPACSHCYSRDRAEGGRLCQECFEADVRGTK